MSYCPHTNTDVRNRFLGGGEPLPLLLGQFCNYHAAGVFEYSERLPGQFPEDFCPDYQHVIYLIDGNVRLARVLQTVAHVVIDENDHGAVVERWKLRGHRHYPTDWVYEPLVTA
jgi:hypothetical protein